MRKNYKVVILGFTFLTMFSISICANSASSGFIDGVVVDEETGNPVPGAIVVVTWEADWWQVVQSQSACFHVESAQADDQGKFHINGWSQSLSGFVSNVRAFYLAYKPGYRNKGLRRNNNNLEMIPGYSPRNTDLIKTVVLRPFNGTKAERLDYLGTLASNAFCDYGGASYVHLRLLYEPLVKEAELLPQAENERGHVENMRQMLNASINSTMNK